MKEPSFKDVPRDSTGKVWGPDLFSWAYDWLAETEAWRGKPDPEVLEHEPCVINWRDEIRDAGGWIPADVLTDVERVIEEADDVSLAVLWVLLAVDRAYHGIRVTRALMATDVEALEALAHEWETHGTLERYAEGAVLRKGSHWRAGSALAHYCNDLARVDPKLGHRVEVRIHNKSWSLGHLARSEDDDLSIDVAYLPTLHEIDDVRLRPDDANGPRFTIELDQFRQSQLIQDAPALIEELDNRGVDVALLPETVAGDDLVGALRSAMNENFQRSAVERRFPRLRLLIVGRAGTRRNDAVVIGANGETLFTQGKTQRWRLSADQQVRYGLDLELGGIDRSEDIVEAVPITYLDDAGFGRIGVLICEDLARGDPSWLVSQAGTPTMILGPVFDASFEKERWAFKAAERLAAEPGSLVLVATSFVLSLRAARNRGQVASDYGVAIVAHPDDWDAQSGVFRAEPAAGCCIVRTITWPQVWA